VTAGGQPQWHSAVSAVIVYYAEAPKSKKKVLKNYTGKYTAARTRKQQARRKLQVNYRETNDSFELSQLMLRGS